MKVSEMIEKLKEMPQDAECYIGQFHGWLDKDMKHTSAVTDKEQAYVYPIDTEHKTVYTYSVRKGWLTYTGVFFETN